MTRRPLRSSYDVLLSLHNSESNLPIWLKDEIRDQFVLLARAQKFVFEGKDKKRITVEARGKGQWAVVYEGEVYAPDLTDEIWADEPTNSERTEAFRAKAYYSLSQAVTIAETLTESA